METVFRVLLYALVAATSPLALGATLAVLTSGRGRLNGSAFALGALIGQSAVCVLLAVAGDAWIPDTADSHDTLFFVLDLTLGVALLATARHVRRHPPSLHAGGGARTRALEARLQQLSPGAALSTGMALGFGGPKRLGVTLLASATIAAADLSNDATIALGVAYILIATVLIWVPVVLYLVFDRAATDRIAQGQAWIAGHRAAVLFYPSLVVGVVLLLSALVQLVGDGVDLR